MADIAIRGTAKTPTGNPTTNGTVVIDAAVIAGDYLLVAGTSRDNVNPVLGPTCTDNDTGGNTWSVLLQSADGKATLWGKRATSGTAGKTITVGSAVGSLSFVHMAFSSVAAGIASPFTNAVQESNASANETHAGFTPAYADCMLIGAVFNYANDNAVTSFTFATAGALTATEKLSTGGSDCGCILGYRLQSGAPAATGNMTWAQADGTTYSFTLALLPALAVTGVGAVASLEAFGTAALDFTLKAVGTIGSLEAFGTTEVDQTSPTTITAVGAIATNEAFGSPTLDFTVVGAGAIASAEALGSAAVDFTLKSAGAIGSSEGFGSPALDFTVRTVGAIASAEAFGTSAFDFVLRAFGAIGSAEALGGPAVSSGAGLSITAAGAVSSAEGFGTAALDFTIRAVGAIAGAEAFGTAVVYFDIEIPTGTVWVQSSARSGVMSAASPAARVAQEAGSGSRVQHQISRAKVF